MTQFPLRTMIRTLFAALILVLAAPYASAAKCEAESFIASAGKAYERAARTGTAAAFASAVSQFSDMNSTAMFALGRYRKLLPKAREAEYVALTRNFMGEFMLEYGTGFRASKLTIVECSGPANNLKVATKLEDGSRVNFRLYRAGSKFLVRDMNVKSIWLVQQMRSTFVGTISREGGNIDALFKYLKN